MEPQGNQEFLEANVTVPGNQLALNLMQLEQQGCGGCLMPTASLPTEAAYQGISCCQQESDTRGTYQDHAVY